MARPLPGGPIISCTNGGILAGLARLISDKRHFTDLNDAEHLHSKRQTPYGQSLGYKRPHQRGDFDFAMITYGSNVYAGLRTDMRSDQVCVAFMTVLLISEAEAVEVGKPPKHQRSRHAR